MSYRSYVGGKIIVTVGGDFNTYSEGDITFNAAKKITFTGEENGVIFGEPKDAPQREQKTFNPEFIAYARYWQDKPLSSSYNLDWKRDKDEMFQLNSKTKSEMLGSCKQGEDHFEKNYESAKISIDNEAYSSPFLMMFQNHKLVTGKEVVLTLHIIYKEINKVKNKKIFLDYDASLLEVGFTNDGETISQKEYTFDKKYFDINFTSNSEYETSVVILENRIILNNVMVKCKQKIAQDTQIKFLDENKKVVGSIIVKANDTAIFSKRNFNYIKIIRKSTRERDLKIIKHKILSADSYDNDGKLITFDDENNSLKHFTQQIVKNGFSKLLVNFKNEFVLDELEIDDEFLIKEKIISETNVLVSEKYMKYVQEKYFSQKKYTQEQINAKMFFFISPIKEIPKEENTYAFVVYEKVKQFSAMVYVFRDEFLIHEIGHEMGLNHTFEGSKKGLDAQKDYLQKVKQNVYYPKTESDIAKWKIDSKSRKPNGYPFDFESEKITNKTKWEEVIKEKENKFEIEKVKRNADMLNAQEIIRFLEKVDEYHQIYFNKSATDNFMDYGSKYGFFNYQHEIIKKLNDEFKHI